MFKRDETAIMCICILPMLRTTILPRTLALVYWPDEVEVLASPAYDAIDSPLNQLLLQTDHWKVQISCIRSGCLVLLSDLGGAHVW